MKRVATWIAFIVSVGGCEEPTRPTIEVPAEFLSPGRYLVEVKTTEATHYPLLRYVIVVRSSQAETP